MCGIAGKVSFKSQISVDEKLLTQMASQLSHRGPDGQGNYISQCNRVGFSHCRLAIVDRTSAASQPMCNEDGTVWVTFNGEIYNHIELRERLVKLGHAFKTSHSDTEILVHGYEEWGIGGLAERLFGDWAFALFDEGQQRVFLMRDRMGVKPLYFYYDNQFLTFGSEIKAILEDSHIVRDMDCSAAYHYLTFLSAPAPLTLFKNIFKLPPGRCLEINTNGSLRLENFYEIGQRAVFNHPTQSLNDIQFVKEKVFQLLDKSIERRMMADVEVGAFLSGGIDSSAITGLMSRHRSRPIKTFTVGFSDTIECNETVEARFAAEYFNAAHHEVFISQKDALDCIHKIIFHQDEPLADWVCIPNYFVSKLAKDNGITVVNVGEGADEQFYGYENYARFLKLYSNLWRPMGRTLPDWLKSLLASLATNACDIWPRYQQYTDIFQRLNERSELFWSGAIGFWEHGKNSVVNRDLFMPSDLPYFLSEFSSFGELNSSSIVKSHAASFQNHNGAEQQLAKMTTLDFKLRLSELLLMRTDKMSMANSLEARVPFLDHELVDFSMSIPSSLKTSGNSTKGLLKLALRGFLPDQIIDRKKVGFGAPVAQWLKQGFGDHVHARIMQSHLLKMGFLKKESIERLFKEHRSGQSNNSQQIWTVFNLVEWHAAWIEKS